MISQLRKIVSQMPPAFNALRDSSLSKYKKHLLTSVAWIAVTTIASCSEGAPGGGGIGGTGVTEPSPASVEGLIIGRVDGFGSIIINERRFETDDAEFLVDGSSAAITDIQIGMKVRARVNYETMIAGSVHYQPAVVGKVESVNSSASTMIVLGQHVELTENTVLDGFTTVSLTNETAIEVSGDRDGDNVIIARYIKLVEDTDDFYTIGEVDEQDTGIAHVALVAGTLVNFSQLAEELGLSASAFADIYLTPGTLLRSGASKETAQSNACNGDDGSDGGDVVINQETQAATHTNINDADGIDGENCIIASSVNIIEKLVFTSADLIEMVGLVSSVLNESSFITNNITVLTDNDTLFYNQFGVSISNVEIQENEAVLINGAANSNGDIVVDSIVLLDRQ